MASCDKNVLMSSSNHVLFDNSRKVFSTIQAKDHVSLSKGEVGKIIDQAARRPPRSNPQRTLKLAKKNSSAVSEKRKRQAIATLLNDKSMATELIRVYANNFDLRRSQKRLRVAQIRPQAR